MNFSTVPYQVQFACRMSADKVDIDSLAGLRNATFPLSDQPILGEWKIFAEVRGQTYNKTFKVEKYGKRFIY